MTTPRLLNLTEQLAILKAADNYARVAASAFNSRERAKRLGDKPYKFTEQRKAARDKLIELLKEM